MTASVTFQDVRDASRRLSGVSSVTPVLASDDGYGLRIKCENLQRSGAFKFRGIYNRIAAMEPTERSRGVIIVSSGNAGLAASIAAELLGTTCTVVATSRAILTKIDAIRRAGGRVVVAQEDVPAPAQAAALAAESGAIEIHGFDDPDVIAGQGTIALEIVDQVPQISCIVVPTSGGSLLAGSVVTLREIRPDVRIIGVEAEGAEVLAASIAAGRLVSRDTVHTIADGLAYHSYGILTFDLVRDAVDDVLTVSDDQILKAMASVWTRFRTAVEPSAAVAFAGAQLAEIDDSVGTVAVMSGGNVNVALLAHALAGGTADTWTSRPKVRT